MIALTAPPLAFAAAGTTPPTTDDVLRHYGFTAADGRELRAGGVIATDVPETSDKELAVAAAMIVATPLPELYEMLRAGRTFTVNRDVVAWRELPPGPFGVSDLTPVAFSRSDADVDEVRDLLDVEPGGDFNLAAYEIRQFQSLASRFRGRRAARSPEAAEAVAAVLRRLLARRADAYRRGGLRAIAPYARDDDAKNPTSPAAELAAAAATAAVWLGEFADAHTDADASPIVDRLYVVKQLVDERPAFILAHRIFQRASGFAVVVERQFFVSHTYNSLQTVTGLVPVEGGTLLFHEVRTSTDSVDGLVSPVAHRIGRGRMRDAVVAHLEALRR